MHGLRRQSQVAHHGNLGGDKRLDHRHPLAASLELHRLSSGSNQAGRVTQRVLDTHVVTHPRQIANNERIRAHPGDCGDVMHHVVDRHLQRVVISEHHHGDGVANQKQVDAGVVGNASRRRVIRRDHHQRRPLGPGLESANLGSCELDHLCSFRSNDRIYTTTRPSLSIRRGRPTWAAISSRTSPARTVGTSSVSTSTIVA